MHFCQWSPSHYSSVRCAAQLVTLATHCTGRALHSRHFTQNTTWQNLSLLLRLPPRRLSPTHRVQPCLPNPPTPSSSTDSDRLGRMQASVRDLWKTKSASLYSRGVTRIGGAQNSPTLSQCIYFDVADCRLLLHNKLATTLAEFEGVAQNFTRVSRVRSRSFGSVKWRLSRLYRAAWQCGVAGGGAVLGRYTLPQCSAGQRSAVVVLSAVHYSAVVVQCGVQYSAVCSVVQCRGGGNSSEALPVYCVPALSAPLGMQQTAVIENSGSRR